MPRLREWHFGKEQLSVIITSKRNIIADVKRAFRSKITYGIEYRLGQLKDGYVHCMKHTKSQNGHLD